MLTGIMLYVIYQRYNFESKSQRIFNKIYQNSCFISGVKRVSILTYIRLNNFNSFFALPFDTLRSMYPLVV